MPEIDRLAANIRKSQKKPKTEVQRVKQALQSNPKLIRLGLDKYA